MENCYPDLTPKRGVYPPVHRPHARMHLVEEPGLMGLSRILVCRICGEAGFWTVGFSVEPQSMGTGTLWTKKPCHLNCWCKRG